MIRSTCSGVLLLLLAATLIWVSCGDEPTPPPPPPVVDFQSSFASGDDGWTAWDYAPKPVQWESDAGRPNGIGGCICVAGEGLAFRAPSELRDGADLSGYYGKQLSFWIRVSGGDLWQGQSTDWNILFYSDYGQLSLTFPEAVEVDIPYRWTRIAMTLSATRSLLRGREMRWQLDGRNASEAEIKQVLSSVDNLLIWADFKTGDKTVYLDDVSIADPDGSDTPDDRVCNGLPYMCEMPFDRVMFPGSHNAGAKKLVNCITRVWVGCAYDNQTGEITDQLNYGIRYLDIDIGGCRNTLVTVHNSNTAGRTINYIMNEIQNFLNAPKNRNEVVVITVADIIGNRAPLEHTFFAELERFHPTPDRTANGDLRIFRKAAGDPWPTLGYLVDTNQRLVVFVRYASDELKSVGVLEETELIHDTWKSRGCTSSCAGVVDDTHSSCLAAPPEKLVLVTVNCSSGLCLSDLAGLCDQHIAPSIDACAEARMQSTGWTQARAYPNFVIADWVLGHGDIVGNVDAVNSVILQDAGFPVSASMANRLLWQGRNRSVTGGWTLIGGTYRN